MSQLYYVMTMPGLETLAFSEIQANIPQAEEVRVAQGLALFRASVAPDEVLKARTVEDVFVGLAYIKNLGPGRDSLRVLHSATLNADVMGALHTWRRSHPNKQAKTWRVVSQMAGSRDFRRVDAGKAVQDALHKTLPRRMRFVEDAADVEIWLRISGNMVLIGMRLSDASMRHRTYKREHLPASLRPTVAAGLNWLAQPSEQDIVLDPLCGAGTILIERGLLAPYKRLLGGDIRKDAVEMARRNASLARVSASLQTWDARELPLDAASVTHIVTNLPFGKQVGESESLDPLYRALIKEFERVLMPGGTMVTLTSEDHLWQKILHAHGWRVTKKLGLVVLGQPASAFVTARAK